MPMFKVNVEALTRAGLREQVSVLVGGAPVTLEYATKAGADGYAPTASATVHVAKALMERMGYDVSGGSVTPETTAAVEAIENVMQVWERVEAQQRPAAPPAKG